MTTPIDQFERWLRVPSETEHLKFKEAKQQFGFDKLLDYCVALANERGGHLVLGVTNKPPRHVVGSAAFPNLQDAREKVFNALHLRVEADEIRHADGRVVVFRVPARPIGMPVGHDGRYLMRVGENVVAMSNDQLQRIFAEAQPDYTATRLPDVELSVLDRGALEEFRARWVRRSGNRRLQSLTPPQLLGDAGLLVDGDLTLAALILFGTPAALDRHLPDAEVVFEYRSSEASIPYQQREELRRGFFGFYDRLWELINLRNDRQSYQDGLFRLDLPTFEETVVREAVLNAISHRDYRVPGSVFVRQYPRTLQLVSPGGFPDGINTDNVIDRQSPRNRKIAEAFALCGLVERSGQGMNRIYEESIKQSKPLPDFTGTDAYQVSLTLRGEMRNPAFVRFLEKLGSDRTETFTTRDYLALDYVHRGEPLPDALKSHASRLAELGAIERMGKSFLLSRALYAHIGQRGVYTRRRGLDRETNKALLLRHIEDNCTEGSPLADLAQVLPHLSERTVQRLLNELRDEARIRLEGQRRWARWFPVQATGASHRP